MAITLRHDAAGIGMEGYGQENRKYGQALGLQQRKYDLDTKLRQDGFQQDLMRQYAKMPRQSGMEDVIPDVGQMIANRQFDPAMARELQGKLAARSMILTNPDLDAAQRASGLANIDRLILAAMGTVQPPPRVPTADEDIAQRQGVDPQGQRWMKNSKGDYVPIGSQGQVPANVAFRGDPKLEDKYINIVQAPLIAAGKEPLSRAEALRQAAAAYAEDQKFYSGLETPQQAAGNVQSDLSQPPAQSSSSSIPANDGPMGPPGYLRPGGRNYISFKPSGQSVTELGGGASPEAAPAGQQPSAGVRKWTSADGQHTTEGEMIGINITKGGDPLTNETVRIRKSNGVEVNVPLSKLSEEDRAMVMSDPQYDYQIRNRGMGGYQQMFDPNNPEYAAMRAPQMKQPESPINQIPGRYGLGGVDYGVNSLTGNRVTGSIRPGGSIIEYDEPTVVRPPVTDANFPPKAPASPGEAMDSAQQARDMAYGGQQADQWSGMINSEQDPARRSRLESLQRLSVGKSKDISDALLVIADPSLDRDKRKKATEFLISKGVDPSLPPVNMNSQSLQPANPSSKYLDPSGSYLRDANGNIDATAAHNWWLDPLRNAIGNKDSWEEFLTGKEKTTPAGRSAPGGSKYPSPITPPQPSGSPVTSVSRGHFLENQGSGFSRSGWAPSDEPARPDASGFSSDVGKQLSESMNKQESVKGRKDSDVSKPDSKSVASSSPSQMTMPNPRSPQAKVLLESLQEFAKSKNPEISSMIMSVYDLNTPFEAKIKAIKELKQTHKIDLPEIERRFKEQINRGMKPQWPSENRQRGKMPTKKNRPDLYEDV